MTGNSGGPGCNSHILYRKLVTIQTLLEIHIVVEAHLRLLHILQQNFHITDLSPLSPPEVGYMEVCT